MSKENQKLEKKEIPQAFKGVRVAIVTNTNSIERVLTKAFTNRGAEVEVFAGGSEMLTRAQQVHFHALVVSDDILYTGIEWIVRECIIQKRVDMDSYWAVGKKEVSRMDGFISKPFRPIELLKPIHETLKAKGIIE